MIEDPGLRFHAIVNDAAPASAAAFDGKNFPSLGKLNERVKAIVKAIRNPPPPPVRRVYLPLHFVRILLTI